MEKLLNVGVKDVKKKGAARLQVCLFNLRYLCGHFLFGSGQFDHLYSFLSNSLLKIQHSRDLITDHLNTGNIFDNRLEDKP